MKDVRPPLLDLSSLGVTFSSPESWSARFSLRFPPFFFTFPAVFTHLRTLQSMTLRMEKARQKTTGFQKFTTPTKIPKFSLKLYPIFFPLGAARPGGPPSRRVRAVRHPRRPHRVGGQGARPAPHETLRASLFSLRFFLLHSLVSRHSMFGFGFNSLPPQAGYTSLSVFVEDAAAPAGWSCTQPPCHTHIKGV